jgi:hypothetical protein
VMSNVSTTGRYQGSGIRYQESGDRRWHSLGP